MKKTRLSFAVGALLLLVFLALLFCFQVRTTEVAVVTTFGRYSRNAEAGLHFRLPVPIQQVHRYDRRLRNYERNFEQNLTRDGKNLLITIYVGWRISDPRKFLELFNGDSIKAEEALGNLVRNAKNGVIGNYNFSDLISSNPKDVKFSQIEGDMLREIQTAARATYGLEVDLVGIKQLGLPEGITTKVFERMRAERDRLVKQYQGEGAARALEIRSQADRQRDELLAHAEADALRIEGDALAQASKELKVLEEDPDLAIYNLQLNALKKALQGRSTLILDQKTTPFNLLTGEKVQSVPPVATPKP
ncbi:MAG: protease modulator HflC [Verrucomicrobiales bacterium]|nr:protease modulator HflC [Verrucomicrobiales bacterium]